MEDFPVLHKQKSSFRAETTRKHLKNKKVLFLTCLDVTREEGELLAQMTANSLAQIIWISTAEAVVQDHYDSAMRSILLSLYHDPIEEVHVLCHRNERTEQASGSDVVNILQNAASNPCMRSRHELENWLCEVSDRKAAMQQTVYKIRSHPFFPADIPVQGWVIDQNKEAWQVVEKPIPPLACLQKGE